VPIAPADNPTATNATLLITNVTLAQDGFYDVLVSNPIGTAISAAARLSILLRPAVIVPPLDQTVVVGGNFTASIELKGNPPPTSSSGVKAPRP